MKEIKIYNPSSLDEAIKECFDVFLADIGRPVFVRIICRKDMHGPLGYKELCKKVKESIPKGVSIWDNNRSSLMIKRDEKFSHLQILSVYIPCDGGRLRGPLIDHTLICGIDSKMILAESMSRLVCLKDGPRSISVIKEETVLITTNNRMVRVTTPAGCFTARYDVVMDLIDIEMIKDKPCK